jgi:hypothetical protein
MPRRPDRDKLKERWRDAQELSGGPFRLSAIKRHIQFSTLHAAAKARASGDSKQLTPRLRGRRLRERISG